MIDLFCWMFQSFKKRYVIMFQDRQANCGAFVDFYRGNCFTDSSEFLRPMCPKSCKICLPCGGNWFIQGLSRKNAPSKMFCAVRLDIRQKVITTRILPMKRINYRATLLIFCLVHATLPLFTLLCRSVGRSVCLSVTCHILNFFRVFQGKISCFWS